jgi:hypothetical protein
MSEPRSLRGIPAEFCSHNSGTIVMHGDSGPLCGDCHTPMIWVAQDEYARLLRTKPEVDHDLLRENQRLRGILTAMQHSIQQIAEVRTP